MQLELVDRKSWTSRAELGRAIVERIEGWHSPRRQHSSLGGLSPADYERRTPPTTEAA
jgi:putative transposase